MEVVDDDRHVIPKANFIADNSFGFGFGKDRFRIGTNKYSDKVRSVVFLGDSVPFGWGVSWGKSIPAQFYKATGKSTINAAVPSYSLHQAVVHYEKAIHGKFPVETVVLQVLDPASQLMSWGKNWSRTKDWSVRKTSRSAILTLLYSRTSFDPDDMQLRARFMRENQKDLQHLLDMVEEDGANLVLIPANLNTAVVPAADWLNDALLHFTMRTSAEFFEVRYSIQGKDMFIDECCHLSEKGALEQTNQLIQFLQNLPKKYDE